MTEKKMNDKPKKTDLPPVIERAAAPVVKAKPVAPTTVEEIYEAFAAKQRTQGEYATEAEAALNWPKFGDLREATRQNYADAIAAVKISGEPRTEFEAFVLELTA